MRSSAAAVPLLRGDGHPGRALPRAGHRSFDESHAGDAVVDAGEIGMVRLRLTRDFRGDRAERFAIEVAEGLEITFRMPGRDPRDVLRGLADIGIAAAQDFARAV